MAQIHSYGSPFKVLPAPVEWKDYGADSTLNDNVLRANDNATNVFTFVDETARAILTWRENFGVFNGMPYRITFFDGTNTNIVFDGYLDLSLMDYDATLNPSILKCQVVRNEDVKTILDDVHVMTQGVLKKDGFLVSSDYVDCASIIQNKKTFDEKKLLVKSFIGKCVQSGFQIINNFLSALSDILGASVAIGIVEMVSTIAGGYAIIKQLQDEWEELKNILFKSIRFYKVISFKQLLTKAFLSKGYTIELGELDTLFSKTYILGSQFENKGNEVSGLPDFETMHSEDYGYVISDFLEGADVMANLRVAKIGSTVHIKHRTDPFWTSAPAFTPDNLLIKSVKQYSNGIFKDDTEAVKGTVMSNYSLDPSDAWTMTEKSGDSYEIRRKLITELNPKYTTLKRIDNLRIPWAMCVRKKPFDNLTDLFDEATGALNDILQKFKDKLNQYSSDVNGSGAGSMASNVLSMNPVNFLIGERAGCLKIEDDTFYVPKIIYLDDVSLNGLGTVKRIPENFKEFIGPKSLYVKFRLPESPANVNDFKGQYRIVENLRLKWSQKRYVQTQTNPYFILNSKNAYFTFVNWKENNHSAEAGIRIQEVFDTNITEQEI